MPTSSCKEIRDALAECLQESDCIMVDRNSAADCMRSPLAETLPLRCQQLKRSLGDCRRGMLDMRKRFRGNLPITFNRAREADEGKGYQLYAGKPAYGGEGGKAEVGETGGMEEGKKDWREIENERYRREMEEKGKREGR